MPWDRQINLDLSKLDEFCDRYQVIATQFASKEILDAVQAQIPNSATKGLYELVDWFRGFMTWERANDFPRFNYVPTLLRTRKGRCGEWAILFTAVMASTGRRSRIVLDFTDHVWTEFFNAAHEWTHVDSTLTPSQAIDNPFIYQDQWGKKLTKIMAFEAGMPPVNVTERYKH